MKTYCTLRLNAGTILIESKVGDRWHWRVMPDKHLSNRTKPIAFGVAAEREGAYYAALKAAMESDNAFIAEAAKEHLAKQALKSAEARKAPWKYRECVDVGHALQIVTKQKDGVWFWYLQPSRSTVSIYKGTAVTQEEALLSACIAAQGLADATHGEAQALIDDIKADRETPND